jgi:membrane associated rhomboid family serine protease
MLTVRAWPVLLAGTSMFLLAFLVLLPFWSWLGTHGHRVWLWTALAGTVLGLLAMPLLRKHSGEGRLG